MLEYGFSLTLIILYKDRIYNSVLIQKNTDQRKIRKKVEKAEKQKKLKKIYKNYLKITS